MGSSTRSQKQRGTLWHQGFAQLITERAPPNIRVLAEFLLSLHPRRADLLLLQRESAERHDDQALVLRGLWPLLGRASLLEFKSPSRGFRAGDLIGLVSYGSQYLQSHRAELDGPGEMTLVLVTPDLTPTLQAELDYMQWRLVPMKGGYARIEGVMYTTYVVFTNRVSKVEADDYLRIFSNLPVQSEEAVTWFWHWMTEKTTMANVQKSQDYEEMMIKLLQGLPTRQRVRMVGLTPEEVLRTWKPEELLAGLAPEERLAGLAPQERLAGLAPEERLAGLAPQEQILALSDEVLLSLPEGYVSSLPSAAQQAIRERLAKKSRRAKHVKK